MFVLVGVLAIISCWLAWCIRRTNDRRWLLQYPGVSKTRTPIGAPEKSLPWLWSSFGASPAQYIVVEPSVPEDVYQTAVAAFPEAEVMRTTGARWGTILEQQRRGRK